ncbi:MAG: 50S ribosomal protein L29 [Candidatus Binatia bacterium]|nr:MAG: 50S ribosomal protein L29 [Candidatus Binatia bacterium]
MRPAELRELGDDALREKLRELREELFRLRLRHATAQLEDTSKLSKTRKDIARIQTILRERELRGSERR